MRRFGVVCSGNTILGHFARISPVSSGCSFPLPPSRHPWDDCWRLGLALLSLGADLCLPPAELLSVQYPLPSRAAAGQKAHTRAASSSFGNHLNIIYARLCFRMVWLTFFWRADLVLLWEGTLEGINQRPPSTNSSRLCADVHALPFLLQLTALSCRSFPFTFNTEKKKKAESCCGWFCGF